MNNNEHGTSEWRYDPQTYYHFIKTTVEIAEAHPLYGILVIHRLIQLRDAYMQWVYNNRRDYDFKQDYIYYVEVRSHKLSQQSIL